MRELAPMSHTKCSAMCVAVLGAANEQLSHDLARAPPRVCWAESTARACVCANERLTPRGVGQAHGFASICRLQCQLRAQLQWGRPLSCDESMATFPLLSAIVDVRGCDGLGRQCRHGGCTAAQISWSRIHLGLVAAAGSPALQPHRRRGASRTSPRRLRSSLSPLSLPRHDAHNWRPAAAFGILRLRQDDEFALRPRSGEGCLLLMAPTGVPASVSPAQSHTVPCRHAP